MIVKENVSVFSCEHCKRKMFRKHAMVKHEKFCASNPVNIPKCYGCKHLITTTVQWDGDWSGSSQGNKCGLTGVEMYSVGALRKDLLTKWPETFEGMSLMPNECELHEHHYPF